VIRELSPKAAEIATHTRRLLASGGYNSFSYADLSGLVRISKASIHHHFPSKAELVQAVVAQYRDEARQGMVQLSRQLANPATELQAYIDFWADCIREGAAPFCICALLATEMPTIPAEVAVEVRGHFEDLSQWLASVLSRGAVQGQLRFQGTAEAEARALMATVHGAMLAARAFADPAAFRDIVQPALKRLTAD